MEDLTFLRSMIRGRDPRLFNYVLYIDVSEYLEGDHYFIERTCFCHVSLTQAKYLICHSDLTIEGVVISASHRFATIAELRKDAREKSIPFILMSLKFEQHIKDMALELKADDYQCGVLDLQLDYIQFMKRLMQFKHNHRGKGKRKRIKIAFGKRGFDILVSSFMLLLLAPILTIVAAIIKIGSHGPLLNVFQRAGHCYKIIDVYEFRTSVNPQDPNCWAARFGHFLKESGLCKLPELINVLKGDISLVGDKPLSLNEAAKLTTDKVAIKLLYTPGLTGLWWESSERQIKFKSISSDSFALLKDANGIQV